MRIILQIYVHLLYDGIMHLWLYLADSGGLQMSTMYEKIIEVLESKGPTNLINLYEELNRGSVEMDHNNSIIAMSSIKSVLSRKKDLFQVNEDIVSIHPEKEIKKLIIEYRIDEYQTFSMHIDFLRETYSIQEWSLGPIDSPPDFKLIKSNQYKSLKRDLYRLKLWDWTNKQYTDSTYTVRLQTLNAAYTYKSSDLESKEWKHLKKFISMFTNLDRLINY